MNILGLMICKNEDDILTQMLDEAPWPFVVLDNGSTDNTPKILDSHPKVLDWFVNRDTFNERRMTLLLHMKAKYYEAKWYVDNDADEFFPKDTPNYIQNTWNANVIGVDIHSQLNGQTYNIKRDWRRIYRNLPSLFDYSSIEQLHHGKIPINKNNRIQSNSGLNVIHKSIRSYEQGMRKYENYKAIDTEGIQKSYEHIRTMAEALKKNDFSEVSFVAA